MTLASNAEVAVEKKALPSQSTRDFRKSANCQISLARFKLRFEVPRAEWHRLQRELGSLLDHLLNELRKKQGHPHIGRQYFEYAVRGTGIEALGGLRQCICSKKQTTKRLRYLQSL